MKLSLFLFLLCISLISCNNNPKLYDVMDIEVSYGITHTDNITDTLSVTYNGVTKVTHWLSDEGCLEQVGNEPGFLYFSGDNIACFVKRYSIIDTDTLRKYKIEKNN